MTYWFDPVIIGLCCLLLLMAVIAFSRRLIKEYEKIGIDQKILMVHAAALALLTTATGFAYSNSSSVLYSATFDTVEMLVFLMMDLIMAQTIYNQPEDDPITRWIGEM